MKIAFGSDHAGFQLRRRLAKWAESQGYVAVEFGAQDDNSYDYPDAAELVACEILKGHFELGVLVCGTGIGMSIRANRFPGIRAAVCSAVDHARLARQHNHANVLCLGERTLEPSLAEPILETFLNTEVDDSPRHVRRVEKLDGNTDRC